MTAEAMVPVPYRVAGRVVETADSVTVRLEPVGGMSKVCSGMTVHICE